MITEQTTYRGVSYNPAAHEKASNNYIEHVYRGKRYQAPLNHEPADENSSVKLNYRGNIYFHRRANAASNSENN